MTKFVNESHGTFDRKDYSKDLSAHHYATVWWDETLVTGFKFHSVGVHEGLDRAYFRIHGVTVEARHIWNATKAFNCVSNIMAVRPDGSEFFVTWTIDTVTGEESFRMGGKWGQKVASYQPQKEYIQNRRTNLVCENDTVAR